MAIQKKTDRRLIGFYIALCCCVLVVGAVGYFANDLKKRTADFIAENTELATPVPVAKASPTFEALPVPEEMPVFGESSGVEVTDLAELIPSAEPENDIAADNPDIEAASSETAASRDISMPLNGDILMVYSDEPAYNSILGDWRTHSGIDIAADIGTEVECAADGEVKSRRETVFGTEITVSHSGGYETIYSQLEADSSIQAGKNLRQGDKIGSVCAPKGEAVTDPHLHFGVKKDGKYTDPADVLSQ